MFTNTPLTYVLTHLMPYFMSHLPLYIVGSYIGSYYAHTDCFYANVSVTLIKLYILPYTGCILNSMQSNTPRDNMYHWNANTGSPS
jgi:hypothetical protein